MIRSKLKKNFEEGEVEKTGLLFNQMTPNDHDNVGK